MLGICWRLLGGSAEGCPQHPMLQNAVLYTWTCLFCVLKYHTEKRPSDGALHSTFNGFSWSIWGAIFLSASYGQVVALVFYYCDNIVKVFANATTVYVSAFVDVIAFGRTVTLQIWIAGFMIALSTITYYCDHPLLLKDDSDFVGILCYSGGDNTCHGKEKGKFSVNDVFIFTNLFCRSSVSHAASCCAMMLTQ